MNPAWLAGSADRERAVGVLRAGFTEGRLSQDELDDRVARAYAARTYGDLWALTADLPQGPLPYAGGLPAVPYQPVPYQPGNLAEPAGAEPATSWHSAAALVITALVIFTLAALVTAIATAHASAPLPFQQNSFVDQGQVQMQPFQHAKLTPFIATVGGHAGPAHAPAPFGKKGLTGTGS
jgi:hypothetical protein